MLEIRLKNKTGKPYANVRDAVCQSLVGNRAFIENDIVVTDGARDPVSGEVVDNNQANDEIVIVLGSEGTPTTTISGELAACDVPTVEG